MAVNGYAAAQDVADLKVSTAALAVAMGTRVHLVEVDVNALQVSVGELPSIISTLENSIDTKVSKADNLSDLASPSAARTSLGLGTMAVQGAGAVAITGGTVTGITDITVTDGGTGASTAAQARVNLGTDLAANVNHTPVGTGGTARSIASIINDYSNSVVSYGAVADGATDCTVAFENAMAAHLGKPIFVPPSASGASYRVSNVGSLGLSAAGGGIIGLSGYGTVIKANPGLVAGTSLFRHINAASQSSAYLTFSNLRFDLNGQDLIAIDLSHCDTCVVDHVNGQGGTSLGTATGTLIKFGAPTDSSSYNNVARDCAGQYFSKAILFGINANQNRVEGGSFVLNDIAIDCAPGGVLLRPQLIGVRVEGNNIGVKEGAQHGVYQGYFENNSTGDFSFTTDSDGCVIHPGTTTASSSTPLHNRANASNLRCLSFDLGYYDVTESNSNTAYEQRRQIRTKPGATIDPAFPNLDFTDLHMHPLMLGNAVQLEGINAANTNSVVIAYVDSANRVNIASYDRGTGTFTRIFIGDNWNFNPATAGLEFAGVKVLGAQGAAVSDATDAASAITQLNALLSRLRAHGLIAT